MSLKLHYFPVKARNLPALFVAGFANLDIEWVQVTDWPASKDSAPFGQLPMLEVDGKFYAQSMSIARGLAKKGGLLPDDFEEFIAADMYAEVGNDIFATLVKGKYGSTYDEQEPNLEKHFALLEGKLAEGATTFGAKASHAEPLVAAAVFAIQDAYPNLLAKYPKLEALYKATLATGSVQKWADATQAAGAYFKRE